MTIQDVDKEFQKRVLKDMRLMEIRSRMRHGTATFADTAEYNDRASSILGSVLSGRMPSTPNGERAKLCEYLLRHLYTDTNEMCAAVQLTLDKALGIQLAPQKAPFPASRVQAISGSLEDQTVPMETIQRRAGSAATVGRSFHDAYIMTNAEFRDRAGLSCSAIREGGAKCCEWCASVSGKYPASDTPQGFWGRHDNCKCSILYETRKGVQRLGGSAKKWEPLEDAGAPEPTRLTAEQAAELEARHPTVAFTPEQAKSLQESVLTNGGNRAKMGVEYDSIELFKGADALTEQDAKTLDDAISVIPANLLQKLSEHVNGIVIVKGRGYSSYNTETREIILDSETASRTIVHELGHAFGAMLNLYEDPEFLRIIANGLDLQDWKGVVPSRHPINGTAVYYYKGRGNSKFVLPYQGRIYARSDDIGKGGIAPEYFREYISVGFDFYFNRPDNLRKKDPDLYSYLEGLINGFTSSSNQR